MKRIVIFLTVILFGIFSFNYTVDAKGNRNLHRGSFVLHEAPEHVKVKNYNKHYDKLADNQRPSIYSTGKKDNIFNKIFKRKKPEKTNAIFAR